MLRTLCAVLVAAIGWIGTPSPAVAQNKLALVIGIDAYQKVPKLERAVADSRAVAKALAELGFKVRALENGTRDAIIEAFAAFEEEIGKGDTAFVFFAGHGVEIRGQAVLLPADAPDVNAASEGVLRDRGLLTAVLIDRVTERGARSAFFVIDACRDNPYAQPGGKRSVGATRGLPKLEAPEGVFVLMSAGKNQRALDSLNSPGRPPTDSDPNSVFTRVFLDELARPGQTHLQLAKQIQTRVRDLARDIGHQQVPAFTDEIIGNVVLRGDAPVAVQPPIVLPARPPVAPVRTEAPQPTPPDRAALARADYERAERLNTVQAWDVFLATSPPEPYAGFARAARTKLTAVASIPTPKPVPTPVPTPTPAPTPSARPGNWLVIAGSFPPADRGKADARLAQLRSRGFAAQIVNTNRYPNLTPGLLAVIVGAYERAEANRVVANVKRVVPDAFVKSGF